ncbi:hypothetical protein OG983_02710 [Streptomyces jietaisiensis]|uniref:hypothetical protein n=1 Tax=Streptomyces griseoaurantiacus TaxID=68213 RepID=UPI002E372A6C|nr:hypothetical protein [Streptomyces jietaisiensis]
MHENTARHEAHRTDDTGGKPAGTAAEEVLEELKELGEEEDTDTSAGAPGGSGDPLTTSRHANREAAEGHPEGEPGRTGHRD